MKILHTSDWHFGGKLNDLERMDEYREAIQYLIDLANSEKVDMVLIAGDVYDTFIPTSAAENLFFESLKAFSRGGEAAVVVVAGNHDEPKRLMAANTFAKEFNIFIAGTMDPVELPEKKFNNINATSSGSGYITFTTKANENAVVACLPYPSYYRYKEMRKEGVRFEDDVKKWFAPAQSMFRKDTINITLSHVFTYPHEPSEEDYNEVNCNITAYPFVSRKIFSENSTYTALGHIHKYMQVSKSRNCYYCGSLIYKYPNEKKGSPSGILLELNADGITSLTPIVIPFLKNVERHDVESLAEAEELAKNNPNTYFQFNLLNFNPSQIEEEIELRKKYSNITTIRIKKHSALKNGKEVFVRGNLTNKQIFEKFCSTCYNEVPSKEVTSLFLELMAEVEHETM